ncbi:MAG: glycine cleavage system protein GcvH [Candidatus Thioglobus sp.]|nr:MAG: glycine cleavage system protein GcvH [Candidatus Thioglobus sp.]
MSEIRDDRKYTKTHEWILDNGDGTYSMGITDHAQELLGDMVFVELPSVGDEANFESEFCVVESVKAASAIIAPADLQIVEVNEVLHDEPELVNSSCYDDGWLVKFKSSATFDLIDDQAYSATLD